MIFKYVRNINSYIAWLLTFWKDSDKIMLYDKKVFNIFMSIYENRNIIYNSCWSSLNQESSEQLPGLKPLLHLGNGQDVGADLSGNGGQIGVLLLQLHQVMKLGYNQRIASGSAPEAWHK